MFCGPGVMDADGGRPKIDELDYELWHACAGPLTSMPPLDSLVMYWPQGHIEQVRGWFWAGWPRMSEACAGICIRGYACLQ